MRYLTIVMLAAFLIAPMTGCKSQTSTSHNPFTGTTTHTAKVTGTGND